MSFVKGSITDKGIFIKISPTYSKGPKLIPVNIIRIEGTRVYIPGIFHNPDTSKVFSFFSSSLTLFPNILKRQVKTHQFYYSLFHTDLTHSHSELL